MRTRQTCGTIIDRVDSQILTFKFCDNEYERRNDSMYKQEQYQCDNRSVTVYFVPRKRLAPYFGEAFGGIHERKCYAIVRDDLPPLVKRFVVQHELYHLMDCKKRSGVLAREVRASFSPLIHDPFGFLATAIATVTSLERIRFYIYRFRHGI